MIGIDLKATEKFIQEEVWNRNIQKAYEGLDLVLTGKGKGNDFLGWVNLPSEIGTACGKLREYR